MVIFNSYVKLPEGNLFVCCVTLCACVGVWSIGTTIE